MFVSKTSQSDLESRVITSARTLERQSELEFLESAQSLREQYRFGTCNLQRPMRLITVLSFGVEAIRRVFGFRLHPVQIRASVAAAKGRTIEMQTGEGKTVVSALIGYYFSHWGHVHLATTNQYLANRDYESIAPVYSLLGLSSGLISQNQSHLQKREAYLADVTFGPGYQFGFDYLHDQTTLRRSDRDRLGISTQLRFADLSLDESLLQQGGHHTMIIDEADSVMIDEALTPLVLAGGSSKPHDVRPYIYANQITQQLENGIDFLIQAAKQTIGLTEAGVARIHDCQSTLSRFELVRPWIVYVENAIRAAHFYCQNVHYVVREDRVKIVDQFTGRIFDDRQWQNGLHQAVCAKECIAIEHPSEVKARVSRQRYFRLYERLIGLSGTLRSVSNELGKVYGSRVSIIPTHQPSIRHCLPTRFFATQEAKLNAIVKDVVARHRRGQPVLLGTRTIRQSQQCADQLRANGLDPAVLNGIQDESEASIVTQAGMAGTITIATNMAGRGTDIKLDDRAIECGGLHVIGFEHNLSRRVDRQLIGRSARQGRPGSSQFFQACDDELFQHEQTNTTRLKQIASREGEIRSQRAWKLTQQAQHMQEKNAARSRKKLMESDRWLNHVRETLVKETHP